jgi:hypothetical protein
MGTADSAGDEVRDGLRLLLDRQKIHDVIMRYCRGIDRHDAELVRTTFHDDAIQNQDGVDRSIADLIEILRNPARGVMKAITHNVCNEIVEIDGDVANSESYFFACHRLEHEGSYWTWIVNGRYVDRLERRDGVWRIAYRKAEYDWSRVDKVEDPLPELGMVQSSDKIVLRFASAEDRSTSGSA